MKSSKIIIFLFFAFLIGCGTIKSPSWEKIGYGNRMMYAIDTIFSSLQVDSLCISDTISNDLSKWNRMETFDFDTKKGIPQFFYNKKNGTVYVITPLTDGKYKVSKRITAK